MTQKQHILLTLGKDLLFILVALFLIVKGRFLGAVVGVAGQMAHVGDAVADPRPAASRG